MKKIYKHKIIILSALSIIMMAAGTALKNGSGAPASYTNAPAESNCTASGCHSSFSLNPTSSNLSNLTLTGTFTGGGYIPDSTYTLTLTYSQSGINRFGMQITCLSQNSADPAGTFTAGTGSQSISGTVAGKTRRYLTHTSASSSGSRTWVFTWKAPSNNVDTVIFYVCVNAANGDGSQSGDEIYAKTFKFGPSSLLPTASIIANKTTICTGDQIQFSGSGTNSPTSYSWKFRGSPSTSSAQNVTVTYSTPGTFYDTLRVTNAKGESAPAVVKITVNTKPPATIISVVPGTSICQGDTAVLTANFGTLNRYSWNTGNPADTLRTLSVTQGGSYQVTVSVAGGCSTTSTATNITVKPKPTLTLTSDATNDEACIKDSVTFTANATVGSTIEFFKNTTSVQTGAGTTYKTTLTATDTVRAQATNNGCTSAVEEKPITIVSPAAGPVISCGTSTTSSVTFDWLPIGSATGYEVSTDTGKTWATPSSGAMGLSHTIGSLGFSTAQALWVRAADNSLCATTLTSTQTCTTLSCSGVTYTTTVADTLLCPGDSTTISIGNISASSYAIKFDNGAFTTDTVFWAKPTATNAYPFEIIDSTKLNCGAAPFNVTVKVDVVPAITTNVIPATTLCFGQKVEITSSTGFANYILKANNNVVTSNVSGTFSNVTVANGDKLFVTGETSAGCQAIAGEHTFTVNPLPKPGFTATINNTVVDFDDTTSTAVIHSWNFGDGGVSMQKNPSHTYTGVGTFDVKLITIDANGCVDSVTRQITTQNVSVGEIAGLNKLEIFPNPTTSTLNLKVDWQGNGPLKLTVTDIAGKTVIEDRITNNGALQHTLNLQGLPGGTYLLRLQADGGEKVLKVLKQDK